MIRSRTASTNSYNKKVYQENLRILDQINRATSELDTTMIKRPISVRRFLSENRRSIEKYLNKRHDTMPSVKQ